MTAIHLDPAPPAGSLVTVTYGGPAQPAPPVPPWLAPDGKPWLASRPRVTLFPVAHSFGPRGEWGTHTRCAHTPVARAARLLCRLQGSGPLARIALWSLSQSSAPGGSRQLSNS